MSDNYFNLKKKLEELGYNNILPVDAVPLVECLLADLLQTTRSLQHYMDLSKEALLQRDTLLMDAEPYKCDNVKLIQENNRLQAEIIELKEQNLKLNKDSKRRHKFLGDEISSKELLISKLQHELRDLSLRGLCAETLSSRNKSKKKEERDFSTLKLCDCDKKNVLIEKNLAEMNNTIKSLKEKNHEHNDEILLLKSQIEHRDNEIIRLRVLLEGGRPLAAVKKDFNTKPNDKMQKLLTEIKVLKKSNKDLNIELEKCVEKQHEAMLRALSLADKNKNLQEELLKVDNLALKVEEDCNKQLASMKNEINFMKNRTYELSIKKTELEKELSQRYLKETSSKYKESLNIALKEKEIMQEEILNLVELNKSLEAKIVSLSEVYNCFKSQLNRNGECQVKNELKKLFNDERKIYEAYMLNIQEKLDDTLILFERNAGKKHKECTTLSISENSFVKDLHLKLCDSEQKILMLQKENEELKNNVKRQENISENTYKEIVSHLNTENSDLSKENILLSQQLSQYKALSSPFCNKVDERKQEICRLNEQIKEMMNEIQLLKKDKHEYHLRYKDSLELVEKLKTDLAYKQKQLEKLHEENCSYKMTNRTEKSTADHLKEECNYLKEQIKKMQTDFIREKTLANQIKNIQLESERSGAELQSDLLSTQKKLSVSKDTIDRLEQKCQGLQSDVIKLKGEKLNLLDNIKIIDKERDKMVLELDEKAEKIGILEKKLHLQTFDISKLENEISDLKRQLSLNKVNEHKIVDSETQITFLNGEILRIRNQYDTAIIENKNLQSKLADVNGILKLSKIELEKSKKDVDALKQQLQHYVAEIRRIEELLSQKEADRSDMLEQFASLSVEANILENTNHSLESESASKTLQLQTYVSKIEHLEDKLIEKDSMIDSQAKHITALTLKVNSLQGEVKLITDEKNVLEQNVSYLKQICNSLQSSENICTTKINESDSELKLYENRLKAVSNTKTKLEIERKELKDKLITSEKLLSNARKEIIELKLALQDATTETKSLHECVNRLSSNKHLNIEQNISKDNLDLPLTLEEDINELSNDDEDNDRYHTIQKSYLKFSHSSTL